MNNKTDLVILAGGKGSRIKKISSKVPKCLIKFNKKPFLDYLINNFSKYNFNKIYILAGYKGNQIFKRYNEKRFNFIFTNCFIEKKRLDTGGSLNILRKKIKNDFVLINGDTIFDININLLLKKKLDNCVGNIALIKNVNYKINKKLTGLGLDNKNYIKFSEHSQLMNGGIYYFKKKIFRYVKNKKQSLENDILPKLIKNRKVKGTTFDEFFLDIGTPYNLIKAKKKLPHYFKRPAAFLDRDGTINYDKGYTYKFSNFKFRPKVIKGLKYLSKNKYYIFIVTNQAGIAKRKFKLSDFLTLHMKIKNLLTKKNIFINDVQFCPYHPNALIKSYKRKSNYRKPGNLMIKKILKNWNIDFKKSFMIGNRKSDELAAKKSNLYFEYVKRNFYDQVKNIKKKATNNY